MKALFPLLLACLLFAPARAQAPPVALYGLGGNAVAAEGVVINEIDADTPGTDEREFIELYNNAAGAVDLSDYVLVLYNGNGDASYRAIDLDGLTIEPGGYLLVGNAGVTGTRLEFPPNTLQNGADAVALYRGKSAADFPDGTAPTMDGLVDAFVYGTNDPDDPELLAALGRSVQFDEGANGDKDNHSIQRSPDGTDNIIVAPATPQSLPAGAAAVSFASAEMSAEEGETRTLVVTLAGTLDADATVDVVLLDTLSAGEEDLTAFTAQTLTFPAGSPPGAEQSVTFTVADDAFVEGLETAVFALRAPEGVAIEGDQLVLVIPPSDVPLAPQTVLFPGVTGQALMDSLQASYTPDRTLGYDVARDTLYAFIDGRGGYVVDVYTGLTARLAPGEDPTTALFEQGINTEHVWPQSMGADAEPLRSDLHHLFPVAVEAGALRGNNPYGEATSAADWLYRGGSYDDPLPGTDEDLYSENASDVFEPKEAFKGDAARALLYVMAVWSDRVSRSFFDQQLPTLLQWNLQDPPDRFEYERTTAIAEYQGNVNPFVVDFTLAGRIWGPDVPEEPTPLAEARAMDGRTVTVAGIVTTPDYGFNNGQFFIEDETGGINVFSPGVGGQNNDTPFAPGQKLRITGEIGSFDDQVQLTLDAHEILSENNPLPAPAVVDAASFTATSPLQGSRVVLEQVILTEESPWPVDKISSGSGLTAFVTNAARSDTFAVRIDRDESAFDPSERPTGYFNLAGTLARFRDEAQIMPFFETDLVPVAGPVATEPEDELPEGFRLTAAYPNPFNPQTTLTLEAGRTQEVEVAVYDALGRRVAVLYRGVVPAGATQALRVELGGAPSGTYFVRARGEETTLVQAVVLAK